MLDKEKNTIKTKEIRSKMKNSSNEDEITDKTPNKNKDILEERLKKPYKTEVVWLNAIGFAILHLIAAYGLYLCFTSAKVFTAIWTTALIYASELSITMGAHRLYTHKAFKANAAIRFLLVTFQTVAGQNCMWVWVRDHRQHHKYSDTDGDPHNASRGFFFSHIGWLMVKKHPDVILKGRNIDMSDIEKDAFVMFQKRFYKTLFFIVGIAIPTAVPCLLWNESWWNSYVISFVLRYVVSLNITWLVNSAAHLWGNKPFSKDIYAVENAFASLLMLGDGWHNYHHTFPCDYRASEYGQHFNVTCQIIDYCIERGWVWDAKSASDDLVRKHATKRGDGSHRIYGAKNSTNVEHDY